jgi:23S rRNA (uracil1939-C5)-methyltransferase
VSSCPGMQPGTELVVELVEIAPSGEALARVGAERVLVDGGLPGERARVRVLEAGPGRTSAELVELLRPSPQRVAPACRHAAECGGCSWQHVAYPEQLRLKRRILEDLLRGALGSRVPRVEGVLGMPVGADGMPWAFRQKAAFAFGLAGDGRGLAMGHFARRTNRLVAVEECPVHSERANRVAFTLRDELLRARVPPASAERGLLRHVLVRCSADEAEAAAVLVVTREHPSLRGPLRRLLASPERPTGLMLNLHDRPGPYLVGRETLRVEGQGHVREASLGPSFLVSPTGFFQTNVRAAGELLRLVSDGLPRRARLSVLDLYSGSGLFALPLAVRGHTVTAVEESRKASRDAALNGRVNGIPRERLRLVCSRVEDALVSLSRQRFDAVILDPPRRGCPPAVLRAVARRLSPERLLLVSCNPEALARELKLLLESGYRARLVQPVDMFPHTPHVETVVVLERVPAGRDHGHAARAGRSPRPAGRAARAPACTPRPKRGRSSR